MNAFEDWATTAELAEYKLPKMPHTRKGVRLRAEREQWQSRPRKDIGGGNEYAITALPLAAQQAWKIRWLVDWLEGQPQEGAPHRHKGKLRMAARSSLLFAFKCWMHQVDMSQTRGRALFCEAYNGGRLPFEGWVLGMLPRVCERSLRNWKKLFDEGGHERLKGNYYGKRKAALAVAYDGRMADMIAALITKNQHLNAGHVRDIMRGEFGDMIEVKGKMRPMPNIRTFQIYITRWKAENKALYTRMTDPDAYKNKYTWALGDASAGIEYLNHVWEMDASPADVLCTDGRHCIYAIIDVWSRRMMVSVSPTATAKAALALLRRAIIEWGVPDTLKLDNGSDFASHTFKNSLSALKITPDYCPPFSPEKKPFVERAIGTLQRGLMPVLPGFIGHSVSDRKKIEAKKAFGQRLGQSDDKAFCVEMTSEELQTHINDWVSLKYERNKHAGIGMSPFEKAATSTEIIRRVENERALDMLLTPMQGDGYRTVTKEGIRLDHGKFFGAGLEVGERVFIRLDPHDMGRIYVFRDEGETFICEAICPERQGYDRDEMAAIAQNTQKKFIAEETARVRREARQFTPAKMTESIIETAREDASNVTAFPKQSTIHDTAALDAAKEATDGYKGSILTPEESSKMARDVKVFLANTSPVELVGQELRLNDEERWVNRLGGILARFANGEHVPKDERVWVVDMQTQPWFPDDCEIPEAFECLGE